MPSIIGAAKTYTQHGMRVFPCNESKRPTTRRGFHDAVDKAAEVEPLWRSHPGPLLGIATGPDSGLVVIDCDGSIGIQAWEYLAEGEELGDLLTFRTPRGGMHLWFAADPDTLAQIKSSVGELGESVDVRCVGGYVIACPSPGYTVIEQPDTPELEIPWLPDWLRVLLIELGPPGATTAPERAAIEGDLVIPEKKRNATLASMAGAMRRVGFDLAAIESALLATNEASCVPPLPEREVVRTAQSIAGYAPSVNPVEGVPELAAAGYNPTRLSGLLAKPVPAQQWLIDGLLPLSGVAIVFGDPNSGKSFLALDMALAIGAGLPHWMGRRVERFGATHYLWGEGGDGLLRRVHAWCRRHERRADRFFLHAPQSVSLPVILSDPASVARLIDTIKTLGEDVSLIVLDTLATLAGGIDENDVAAVQGALNQVRGVALELGCLVVLVHHTGHGAKGRERGSSALRGAVDLSVRVEGGEKEHGFPTGLVASCSKMRNARFFDDLDLVFHQQVITDDSGQESVELVLAQRPRAP